MVALKRGYTLNSLLKLSKRESAKSMKFISKVFDNNDKMVGIAEVEIDETNFKAIVDIRGDRELLFDMDVLALNDPRDTYLVKLDVWYWNIHDQLIDYGLNIYKEFTYLKYSNVTDEIEELENKIENN